MNLSKQNQTLNSYGRRKALLARMLCICLVVVFIAKSVVFAEAKQDWVFNIKDYGAVGDGKILATKAIQAAVDACHKAGGGKVIIPPGVFLSGTIILKDNVEIHFEHNAILLGSTRHEDYQRQPTPIYRSHKDKGGFYALLYAESAKNIALTGDGTIDGQGAKQKGRHGSGDQDGRPRNILLVSCNDIRVEGLHMRNSGMWNQHYLNCEDVIICDIKVYNHSNRNNDGIDIDGCRRVILADSIIDSDDDGVVLKSTGTAATEDVVITNCIISSFCNAIKAGTESTGGFRNITISNCVIKPSISKRKPIFGTPKIGITGLSLIIVDGGTMEGVTVNNLTIHGTMAPLYIRLGNRARPHSTGVAKPGMGTIRNISINNVVAYGAGAWGSSITGIPDHPVQNISLSNIQLLTAGGVKKDMFKEQVSEDLHGYPQPIRWGNLPAFGLFLRHVRGISLDGVVMGTEEYDVRCPIWVDDVQHISIKQTRLLGMFDSGLFVRGFSLTDYEIEPPLGWKGKANELIQILDSP